MSRPPAEAPPTRSRRARRPSGAPASRARRSRGRWARAVERLAPLLRARLARRVVLGIGGVGAALLLLTLVERVVYSGQVLPGVAVSGADVAGLGERAAYERLGELAARLEAAPVRARAGSVDLSADPTNLGLDVDELATLRDARRVGRSRNPIGAVAGFVLRRVRDDRLDLRVEWSDPGLEGVLDGWAEQVQEGTVEGGLRFEGVEVVVVPPQSGTGIVRAEARSLLQRQLRGPERDRLDLPVGRVEPGIDLDDAQRAAAEARDLLSAPFEIVADGHNITVSPSHVVTALGTRVTERRLELTLDPVLLAASIGDQLAPLSVDPVNARFEVTPDMSVRVVPSRDGRHIDMAAVAEAMLRLERRIEAPLRVVKPERDTEWAESLGIVELVSSFTTRHPSGQSRVTNIHVAADLINEIVVEPGATFSLNDAVGPRTPERGFVSAPVYYGDSEGFTEDFGGGVSQLATTVFNAVFWAGLEDVTHKPHTIYFSRYPMGREATVNYPSLDLQFRNNSDHGILVRTFYDSSSITVMFFGDREGKVVREEVEGCSSTDPSSRCVSVVAEQPVETKIVQCPTSRPEDDPENRCADLRAGEQVQVDDGHKGFTVEFWRVIERPGLQPAREKFTWRYRMLPAVVLVGDPNATTTTAPPATSTTSAPTGTTAPSDTTAPATTVPATTTTTPAATAP